MVAMPAEPAYVPAMSPSAALMTADELLHANIPNKRTELVRGVLRVREPASSMHGRVAMNLGGELRAYARSKDASRRPTRGASRIWRPISLSRSCRPTTGRVRSSLRLRTGCAPRRAWYGSSIRCGALHAYTGRTAPRPSLPLTAPSRAKTSCRDSPARWQTSSNLFLSAASPPQKPARRGQLGTIAIGSLPQAEELGVARARRLPVAQQLRGAGDPIHRLRATGRPLECFLELLPRLGRPTELEQHHPIELMSRNDWVRGLRRRGDRILNRDGLVHPGQRARRVARRLRGKRRRFPGLDRDDLLGEGMPAGLGCEGRDSCGRGLRPRDVTSPGGRHAVDLRFHRDEVTRERDQRHARRLCPRARLHDVAAQHVGVAVSHTVW